MVSTLRRWDRRCRILVRPGMPPAIVAKLNTEISRILVLPDVKRRMEDIAVEVASMRPQELGELTRNDAEKWGRLIKELGVTAQ